jgi:uncharacterized protein (TIGR00106 family)
MAAHHIFMAVIVEFSVIPLGEGTSVSSLVARAVKALEDAGIKHVATPMGTILEAESLEEALQYVKLAHEAVFKAGAKRVVTMIKIDDRRDAERRMEDKLRSLDMALKNLGRKKDD